MRALDEAEVDGIRCGEVSGRGLDDGEALGRVGRGGGVEAEERGAGEEGGEGGVGVKRGVDFIVQAAAFDAWGVAAGDVTGREGGGGGGGGEGGAPFDAEVLGEGYVDVFAGDGGGRRGRSRGRGGTGGRIAGRRGWWGGWWVGPRRGGACVILERSGGWCDVMWRVEGREGWVVDVRWDWKVRWEVVGRAKGNGIASRPRKL